jgi:hypothetical protein
MYFNLLDPNNYYSQNNSANPSSSSQLVAVFILFFFFHVFLYKAIEKAKQQNYLLSLSYTTSTINMQEDHKLKMLNLKKKFV